MKKITLSALSAALLLAFSTPPAIAFEVPEKYKKFDFAILEDSTDVDVNDTGAGKFKIKKRVQILTPKGAQAWRIIKYDYDPLTAAAGFSSVAVVPEKGARREIPPATQLDYAAPARKIYWGARQIMIEVGRLEAGDIVEYEIAKSGFTYALLNEGAGASGGAASGVTGNADDEERFVPPMRGEFYDIVPFWVEAPTEKKTYSVALPAAKDLQFEFFQGECAVSVKLEGNKRRYTFSKKNILPEKKEARSVNEFDFAPKLFLSTTREWREKSRWFYKVNEDYGSFAAFAPAQKKVDELLRGVTDERKKISILTHWVADNMRYSGLPMGKGEGFTLHNTEMNFTDRCGVCKDKAALLISMLRMAGFEAYPAMTMAGSRIEKIPADHFNHCVTVVKLSDGTLMPLDPTWVPFVRELWSSAEQQQNYLPGIPGGAELQITPVSPPENHYLKIDVSAALDENGTLAGTVVIDAEGQSDALLRRIFTANFKRDRRALLEAELLAVSPTARLTKLDCGAEPRDYAAGPIRIKMDFSIPGYAFVGEKELIFAPFSASNFLSKTKTYLRLGDAKERKFGFRDACSREVILSEKITAPAGFLLKQKFTPAEEKNKTAEYSVSVKQEGNEIIFQNRLALQKRVYEAGEWPAFSKAVEQQTQFLKKPLVLQKKTGTGAMSAADEIPAASRQ